MPKISIITTTYRHEQFIVDTIESIIQQSYTDWELLIGDDSPDDTTWAIIQQYTESYPEKIRAWHHVPSKGIVGNMNFLLSQTTENSKHIAFLEGDDMYTRDHLEKKLKIWEQYPELGLVYNELSTIDENGDILERYFIGPRTRKWYKNETNTIGNFLMGDMTCFSYSTLMVKKYDGIQVRDLGREGLMGSETDFWVQIASRSCIYGIEDPITLYRKHRNNTSKDLDTTIEHYEYLIEHYFQKGYIQKKDLERLRILISMMRTFASLQKGEYLRMLHHAGDCFRISPIQTCIIGFQSLYYRGMRPFVSRIFSK